MPYLKDIERQSNAVTDSIKKYKDTFDADLDEKSSMAILSDDPFSEEFDDLLSPVNATLDSCAQKLQDIFFYDLIDIKDYIYKVNK